MKFQLMILILAGAVVACDQNTHGDAHSHSSTAISSSGQKPYGIAGEADKVARTINVEMADTMRFTPNRIEIKNGETVRFVIQNKGKLQHEMVLGTRDELNAHAAAMRQSPTTHHEEPQMVQVASGKTGDLIWQFNRPGEFQFACLVAGHFEAGMVGDILVK